MASAVPQIITSEKFKYYKNLGKVLSNREIQLNLLSEEKKKNDLIIESQERQTKFNKIDSKKVNANNHKLDEVLSEARKRSMHLLQRANNLRMEQDEEVQKCSRIILEKKCRAVRDAQIAEKEIINQELKMETQNINDMMENERRLAIKLEIEKKEEEYKMKRHYADALKTQITENDIKRQIEIQRKQEENSLNNYARIMNEKEEISKLKAQEVENAKIRKNLSDINNQLKHFKNVEKEESKIMEARIQEYHRMRQERDRENVLKQKLIRHQREKTKEKVSLEIQNFSKMKNLQQEINTLRIQEKVERAWKLKEKEEALEAAKNEMLLKLSREEQIREKQIMLALEIKRDKEQLDKFASIQSQANSNELKDRNRKQQEAIYYRNEILKQINEKENERRLMNEQKIYEGLMKRKEMESYKRQIDEAIRQKFAELEGNALPENSNEKNIH
ncbi:cilia- and flagella-associated protein 45-like [Leptopilina heterotoma]|uniref:cilia- and flagella-associated protein 45-like n=1 Tax=Leptopilina heterotoma TaxID=63436 RepID=UPI001CA7BD1E|nr:cilia- and flagella-associated protein 45-like [Leptopilina heterotoma]XP_043470108.1 cilia- and flagella-associated protein 45-like [Leptopilina heterotoma]